MGFSLRGCEQARENLWRECGDPSPVFDVVRARTEARWRRPPRPGPGGGRHARPATGHVDRALPLADQAVLRRRREPVLADAGAVRVRHLHDVGHLQDPAPAADGDHAEPGRGPAGVADPGLRGGGQLPDRLPDGPRRGPLLPAGAARSPTPRSPTRTAARPRPASTGLGAGPHGRRPAPHCTARTSSSTASSTRSRTRSTSPTATTARPRSRGRWATSAWPTTSTRAAGCWVNAFDPTTGLLRDSEFYEGGKWNYSFRLLHDMACADRPRGRRRRVRRDARRVLRLRRRRR